MSAVEDKAVPVFETDPGSLSVEPRPLSKNQQKRLLREKLRQATKAEWRKKQKEKRKSKQQAKKIECESKGIPLPVKKRAKPDPTKEKSGRVVFDMSFDGIMASREQSSLCSQIMRCYSVNRQAEVPFNLELTSLCGEIATRFKTMYPEHERWDMKFTEQHFTNGYDRQNIVYLTPDTDNVLETVDPDAVYIIGGIVDKNRFKGKTNEVARQQSLRTARLPVPEHIDLKTSPVLTIFHVLEILLKFRQCGDWKESLEAFVPRRNMKPLPLPAPVSECETASDDALVANADQTSKLNTQ